MLVFGQQGDHIFRSKCTRTFYNLFHIRKKNIKTLQYEKAKAYESSEHVLRNTYIEDYTLSLWH